jgi:hypothetical protein
VVDIGQDELDMYLQALSQMPGMHMIIINIGFLLTVFRDPPLTYKPVCQSGRLLYQNQ